MKNSQLENILHELGLSENESRVYLTGLALGPTTVLDIARAAEVRRTTVYSVIDALKKKGLMFVQPKGFKQAYAAEHPDKLLSMVENKKRDLQQHLPEFLSLYNLKGGQSTIKYYEGLESIKSIYDTIFDPLKPGDDYLVISDLQKFADLDRAYFEKFFERRTASRVRARIIATDSPQARYMEKYAKNLGLEIRILPSETQLSIDTMITDHTVTTFNMEQPLTALAVENPTTIRAQKELFEIMWRGLGS